MSSSKELRARRLESVLPAHAGWVRELKAAKPAVMNEVRVNADYLRDVRNYGLHPREQHDADRETPFSEAGCTALFMASRRSLG